MKNLADIALLQYVNQMLNSGTTKTQIPAQLITPASKEAIKEAKRLCKLNSVTISGVR